MEIVITRCAGFDVHKATVVATVRVPGDEGGRRIVTETFGTMTPDLIALREWLQAFGVTQVARESTGVYGKPVYYVLEDAFALLLINMQELKRVPGRKTDVKDSEWLAQLLECGLLRSSFVPPPPIRELRDLTRYRVQQTRDRSREVNRLQKVLEDAGVKVTSVLSDIMGVSGRAMVEALVAGTTDPQVLADLARGTLRKKLPALQRALVGRFRPVHAFLLEQILAKIDYLDEALERLTAEIDRRVAPFAPMLTALDTIPGINRIGAISLLAETGGDMTRFPSAAHLCSWAGMCPGHDESAGKRRSGKTRKANRYLRTHAHSGRQRGVAQERLGPARVVRAGEESPRTQESGRGHRSSDSRDRLLRDARGVTYRELGADYFQRRDRDRTARRHVKQLEALGYVVTVQPAA